MSNFDFGLSNQYLKFGVALILLGPAMLVVASALGAGDSTSNLMIISLVLFMTGVVVYVIGRIVKAASHVRK